MRNEIFLNSGPATRSDQAVGTTQQKLSFIFSMTIADYVRYPFWTTPIQFAVQQQIRPAVRMGLMSAFGTKRTWSRGPAMSAFGGKADMTRRLGDVCF
jgi:hypothetical protein